LFVIYDLEFTAWPGSQERGWTGDQEFREIVQIGAVRVDEDSLEADAEFDVLIRPARNPYLSPYFEDLTGITNDAVAAEGQDFASAFNAFLKFCGGAYALSYGNDMVIIGENLILQFPAGEAPATPLPPFINVRPHINRSIPATRTLSAGALHEALGSPPRGRAHNALTDCYGILDALRHLRRHGQPLIAL
jgi:inhibitor of KinA sporulation pathway (predicted exonuclease)